MSDYLLSQGSRRTSQSQKIPGTDQVENSAGGFAWEVTPWTRLRRFLILGSEGGSYYASERDLTLANASCVRDCIKLDGVRTVEEIVAVSRDGRAPKNDPALWALAACMSYGDDATKRYAATMLPTVARIGTHLYHFVAYAETMRGWGRVLRRAVAGWYETMPTEKLALQAIKYRQRDGWSHRDLLRLSKPVPSLKAALAEGQGEGQGFELAHEEVERRRAIFDWICRGKEGPRWNDVYQRQLPHAGRPDREKDLGLIAAFESAQLSPSPKETARLVRDHNLPREALLSEHLNSPEVWDAMLATGMPMTALIRNLATMTRAGVLTATSDGTKTVINQLLDTDALRRARVHPIQVLIALLTYRSGVSVRGSNTWQPVARIIDALDGAFYGSFGNVEPTGKRTLLALDVSGSMDGGNVDGRPGLSPRMASAAMAMVTARVEETWECVGFYSGHGGYQSGTGRSMYGQIQSGITPLAITPRQRLDDIVGYTAGLPFGGTDCALPMMYAAKTKQEFDTFIIYTDSETWAGSIHPSQALREYREQFVPDAKLVVVGMVSNGFSIADPNDPGMMDVVGFDTAAPNIISDFARGNL